MNQGGITRAFNLEEDIAPEPGSMVNYDQENINDGENAQRMLHTIILECDTEKIEMWFQILENKMSFLEVHSQWTKLQVLTSLLSTQPKVLANIESFAAQPRASASNNCYYRAKQKLLSIYSKKPEDKFDLAMDLVMVTTPSDLARQIVDLICENKAEPMATCCACQKTCFGIWRRKMSEQVKTAIAGKSFANGQMETVLSIADAIEKTTKVQGQTSSVEAAGSGTAQEGESQVSVLTRGGYARGGSTRGWSQRGGYRGRGRGRGRGQGQGQKGQETVPEGSCPQHKRYGREAYYCMDVSSCPMKDILQKRQ